MLLALQRTAGNRAVSRAITVQRILTNGAAWSPVEPVTGQGTHVRAIIGPGYIPGSKTQNQGGFRPYDYTSMFSAATEQAFYCQGHLLNEKLGGPGAPGSLHADENLTAFPQRPTNTDHKTAIETPIRKASNGAWFRYEVTIGYSTDSAPRLRHRLKKTNQQAMATALGIAKPTKTFTYASSLTAHWEELQQDAKPASTNAAPTIMPGGNTGTLSLAIPSPMTFTTNQAGEYPGYAKVVWQHLPTMKGNQAANRIGTLPGGGNAVFGGRAHVAPLRWNAVAFARAGNLMPPGQSPTYQAGFQHYGEGVASSRAGTVLKRYGLGFTTGYADFEAGIVHGRAHAETAPPAPPPQATVDGHNELWAGVKLGRTNLLAAPPVGNRAHIVGHAAFWAGVERGRTHDKLPPPKLNLAKTAGHNEYWAGIELGYTTTKATKPAGNLAREEGHRAYWEGAEAARADLATAPVPPTKGKLEGHKHFVEGVTHAQGTARATPPAAGSLVRTEACREYWLGVDFARANPSTTPYAGPSSAEKAGVADYRAGADAASKDFGAFSGAPPAAGGGAREGFDDLKSGAQAHQAGTPADAARSAHLRGWQDSAAGMAAGAVLGAVMARTDGGYVSGFLNAHGAALAQGGQASPVPTAGPGEAAVAAGHTGYDTGLAAARTDLLAPAPVPRVQALAHGEFLSGVAHARANARGVGPGAGSVARTAACREYWQGVDFARANLAAMPYAGPSSAERAGVLDYRAGSDQPRASLAALAGAAPVGGGSAEGFADYRDGVDAQQRGVAADVARSAQAGGWQDSSAGMTAGGAVAPGQPARTDGGFMSGFLHAHGAALARDAQPAPAGGLERTVAAGGHAEYGAGLAAARADLLAVAPVPRVQALAHGEFLAGVAHARASARGAAPAAGSAARTQAWTEYWQGVDFARANPVATPYAGPSSAERAGVTDYRSGADQAESSLAALSGAGPAGGGAAEGFVDVKAGVDARLAGVAADASRSGQVRGWQDCAAGMVAGAAVAPAPPVRADGGFLSGFLNAHGAALAQGNQGAPVGGLPESVAAGGHAGYQAGMALARVNLASPVPAPTADALGHGDFVAGVTHARANARGVGPGAGSVARTAAFTEYWLGVDFARANPAATAYAGPSSAEAAGAADYRVGLQHAIAQPSGTALPSPEPAAAEGAADYWQGEAHAVGNGGAPVGPAVAATTAHYDYWNGAVHARASLVNLQGPAPAGRVEALGFAAYRSGVDGAHQGTPDIPANIAYSQAWTDYTAGAAAARAGAVNALRTHSGYLYGVQQTNPAVVKRKNDDPGPAAKKAKHL